MLRISLLIFIMTAIFTLFNVEPSSANRITSLASIYLVSPTSIIFEEKKIIKITKSQKISNITAEEIKIKTPNDKSFQIDFSMNHPNLEISNLRAIYGNKEITAKTNISNINNDRLQIAATINTEKAIKGKTYRPKLYLNINYE